MRTLEFAHADELASLIKDKSEKSSVSILEYVWRTGTSPDSGKQVKLSDMLMTHDAPLLMPKVVSNIIRETQEPLLVGAALLQRINYTHGQTITFGAVGALQAADIPEGGEYPEQKLPMGGSNVTATIGKVGLAIRISDEMIRYSQFDVIRMHLNAAARGLARFKEQKIFNMVRRLGTVVFDNVTPTNSLKGVTTGRELDGAPNASITSDDIFDMYAQVLTQGFVPDTLLVHPLMWVVFVKDPVLRMFALASGNGQWFQSWSGNVNQQFNMNASQNGLGIGAGSNLVAPGDRSGVATPSLANEFNPAMDSAPVLPGYMGMSFRVVVSPFVHFDTANRLTDVYMFDSSALGALVVDQEPTSEEWREASVGAQKIRIHERYAVAVLHEGQGVASARNVRVVPNQVVLPAQATLDVASSALGTISPTANVL